MSILFVDGFDYNAAATEKYGTATNVSYVTSPVRTGSRALRLNTNLGTASLRRTLGSSYDTISVACGMYAAAWNSGTTYNLFSLLDSAGNNQFSVRVTGTGTLNAYRGDGVSLLGTGTDTLPTGAWFHLEIGVTINDTTGVVNVYKDGTSILAVSGVDTKQTAVAGALTVSFANPNATANAVYLDDLVVSDSIDQIGPALVQTLYPTGAGATTEWDPSAGNNWAAVDETPGDGDTTYVSTSTLNEVDTYVYGNLASNSGSVLAVAVNSVGRADAGGSPQIAPVIRPGSTNYVGTGKVQSGTYSNTQHIWQTNPDGGNWSESAVNGSEAGIKKTA